MRPNHALLSVVLFVGAAALCTSACKKTPDADRQKVSQAELHSAHIEPQAQVIDEKNDLFAMVRREQLQLRARLQDDITDIDEKLAELKVERRDGRYVVDPMAKSAAAARTRQLLERRRRLEEHAATVERADERGWAELKATVEQDLRD